MESPESQLSDLLFFDECFLNLVFSVEFSNRDPRFPKFHENSKIMNFGCIFTSEINVVTTFMEVLEVEGLDSKIQRKLTNSTKIQQKIAN